LNTASLSLTFNNQLDSKTLVFIQAIDTATLTLMPCSGKPRRSLFPTWKCKYQNFFTPISWSVFHA